MIDLRSDTVTQPTAAMREAMSNAEVGDDVYGEDPTVNRLETRVAKLLGKASALLVPSGTQSNLLALLSHCERGDEYIAGQDAHTYRYEAGGGAVLGSIQPQPLPFNDRGELDLNQVREVIKPDDAHFAKTRLICLENTQAGRALTPTYLTEFGQLLAECGLSSHLDGARLLNASIAQKTTAGDLSKSFDSVSLCLSKGLGCPVGSVLVGDESFIARARRLRKMLGGGMRQAGILAAAGLFALDHHVDRLAEDHHRAQKLADHLHGLGIPASNSTNMVMLAPSLPLRQLQPFLQARGIVISTKRLVFHLDVEDSDLDQILTAFTAFAALAGPDERGR